MDIEMKYRDIATKKFFRNKYVSFSYLLAE